MKHIKLFESFDRKSPITDEFKEDLSKEFPNVSQEIISIIENDYSVFSDAYNVLEKINTIIDGYGVEPLYEDETYVNRYWQNTIALYVNMSDTYIMTILYNTEDEVFECTSWGDFYEKG